MQLDDSQIQQFIENGFLRLDNAFSRKLADEGREVLWRDIGCDPHNPKTWTQPVIRLGGYAQEPFREAVNTPLLHYAFDQLVGEGRWEPRASLGTFPIRFPSPNDPGDAGWHIDASFAEEDSDPNDFFSWRVNVYSKGRRASASAHISIWRTILNPPEKRECHFRNSIFSAAPIGHKLWR
jgi:hypothetical protein